MVWADITEWDHPDWFHQPHWMGWRMPNSNDLVNVTLSGTVELFDGQHHAFMGAPAPPGIRTRSTSIL